MSATFVNTRFEGGNGNDTINLRGDAVYSAMNLNANKGSDSVIFNGSISGTTNSVIGLGAGNDALTGDFVTISTSTIAGGKGNDVLTLSATTMDQVVIGLDRANASNTDADGNDSFNFYGGTTFTGSTIYGGGGNDSVTYSANGMTASVVSLNDGADIFKLRKRRLSRTPLLVLVKAATNSTLLTAAGFFLQESTLVRVQTQPTSVDTTSVLLPTSTPLCTAVQVLTCSLVLLFPKLATPSRFNSVTPTTASRH